MALSIVYYIINLNHSYCRAYIIPYIHSQKSARSDIDRYIKSWTLVYKLDGCGPFNFINYLKNQFHFINQNLIFDIPTYWSLIKLIFLHECITLWTYKMNRSNYYNKLTVEFILPVVETQTVDMLDNLVKIFVMRLSLFSG